MAEKEKKGPPKTLEEMFANKGKKKPKATNMNAAVAAEKPEPAPAKPTGPTVGDLGAARAVAAAAAEAADKQEGWERALRRDQDLLKACGLWIKEVEGDGACLFRAFADQIGGDEADHASFREQCVDFMQAHRSDFEPFLEEPFEPYCARMRRQETWGGHVEAQALCRAAGVSMVIYRPAEAGSPEGLLGTTVEIATEEGSTRCAQLSFHPTHHAGQHYNSVRCAASDGATPAANVSIAELRRRVEEALRP